jgi:serine/threonine-protein kinase RsbW
MITMTFSGRFSSLDTIRKFYAGAAEQAGMDEESIADIELAVDEAACNIIDHAYGGEGKGEIECSYRLIPGGLEVILHDYGKPFDPEKVEKPDLNSDVCCREPGGLGLHFMRSLMDSVKFSFNGHGGNLLTMTKLQKKAIRS